MISNHRVGLACIVGLMAAAFAHTPAWAGSHTWRVNEVFSSADGTVQFIELMECMNSAIETGLSGHQVKSNANTVNLNSLPPNSSASKHLLFGTANLPSLGGPTPDYIITGNFYSLLGDLLQYTPYHACTVASGTVPTNGTSSLNRVAGCSTSDCPTNIALNSPTNFADQSGSVTVPGPQPTPTVSQWGLIIMASLLLVAGTVITARRARDHLISPGRQLG